MKKNYFKRFLFLSTIIFVILACGKLVYSAERISNLTKNRSASDTVNFQEQIGRAEAKIEKLNLDSQQKVIDSSNKATEQANTLINFVGLIATIFGIIIALASLFLGYETVRTRQRSEEAIRTLENAKTYVQAKTNDFDAAIQGKILEVDKRYKELVQLSLEQLSGDAEDAAKKIKEIKERGVTTETENKIDLLERRIKFFEDVGLPDDPKLLFSKAMIYKEKGLFDASLRLLQRAVDLDRKYKSAFWQIGSIQYELKNYRESEEAYIEAIKLDPKDPSAYNNLGVSLKAEGKNDEALEYYNLAIKISPKKAKFYYNKAVVLDKVGKYEEAFDSIKKAIELDSNDRASFLLGGRILFKMNKIAESKEYYRKSSEIIGSVLNDPKTEESDWVEYFENLLLIEDYKQALSFKLEKENRIKAEGYSFIFDLLVCFLFFLQDTKDIGYKRISEFVEKYRKCPPKVEILWSFEDINLILKLRLPVNICKICITLEEVLAKKISLEEAITEIKKLRDQK